MKEMIKRWEDLTINQYIEIFKILDNEEPETEQNIKILAVILGKTYDDIVSMPISEVGAYMNQLVFLKHKPEPNKLKKEYILQGKTYTIFKDYKKLSTAQYIDFQSYGGDLDKNIKDILAIMLIPEGYNYNEGYEIDELKEIIGNGLTLGDGLALIGFFGIQLRKSIKLSLQSSKRQLRKTLRIMKKKDKEAYEKMKETIHSYGFNL